MDGEVTKISLCQKHQCVFVSDECPACEEYEASEIQKADYEQEIERLKDTVHDLNTKLDRLKS